MDSSKSDWSLNIDQLINYKLDKATQTAKCDPRHGWEQGQGKCVRVKAKNSKQKKSNRKSMPPGVGKFIALQALTLGTVAAATLGGIALAGGELPGQKLVDKIQKKFKKPLGADFDKVIVNDDLPLNVATNNFQSGEGEVLETIKAGGTQVSFLEKNQDQFALTTINPGINEVESEKGKAMIIGRHIYRSAEKAAISSLLADNSVIEKSQLVSPKKVNEILGQSGGENIGSIQKKESGLEIATLRAFNDLPESFQKSLGLSSNNERLFLGKEKNGGEAGLDVGNLKAMTNSDITKIMALDTFMGYTERYEGELSFVPNRKIGLQVKAPIPIDTLVGNPFSKTTAAKSINASLSSPEIREAIKKDPELARGLKSYGEELAQIISSASPEALKSSILRGMKLDQSLRITEIKQFYEATNGLEKIDRTYKDIADLIKEINKITGS